MGQLGLYAVRAGARVSKSLYTTRETALPIPTTHPCSLQLAGACVQRRGPSTAKIKINK